MSDKEPTIIRTRNSAFFTVPRSTAQDRNLSFAARGVLMYLLSKPDNWTVRVTDLQQGCGRDKVRSLLAELETARYLKREQEHDKDGKFKRAVYRVYDTPQPEEPQTETPQTENPATVNPPLHNIESTEERKEKDSVAVATVAPVMENPQPVASQSTPPTLPEKTDTRPRNAWYDAVQKIFGFQAGLNCDYQKMLRGEATKKEYKEHNIEPGLTLEELQEWHNWYCGYERTSDGKYVKCDTARSIGVVQKHDKLQSSVYEFRQWKLNRLKAVNNGLRPATESRWSTYEPAR